MHAAGAGADRHQQRPRRGLEADAALGCQSWSSQAALLPREPRHGQERYRKRAEAHAAADRLSCGRRCAVASAAGKRAGGEQTRRAGSESNPQASRASTRLSTRLHSPASVDAAALRSAVAIERDRTAPRFGRAPPEKRARGRPVSRRAPQPRAVTSSAKRCTLLPRRGAHAAFAHSARTAPQRSAAPGLRICAASARGSRPPARLMSSADDRDAADEQLPAGRYAPGPACNAPEASGAAASCGVCWDQPCEVLLTACGHAVLCKQCFERLLGADTAPECPLCKRLLFRPARPRGAC